MSSVDLPYELWRPIFRDVYATKNHISDPPSDFIFSKLHRRLNVYRCLAAVSRSWRTNARDVFFEELQVHTTEALRGLIVTFREKRDLALAVSRLEFSFAEYRCSASVPRRPRPLVPETAPTERVLAPAARNHMDGFDDHASSSNSPPDWKTIHRRDALRYRPSSIGQARHFSRWQADVAEMLRMCSSLSDVDIDFTSTSGFNSLCLRHGSLKAWFPTPDLTNERLVEGLLQSTNLKSLNLINPTPLEVFGPYFVEWKKLKSLSITLTRSFKELETVTFIPPKSLSALRFHDRSSGKFSWPLSSDMGKCTNLQVLDLGLCTYNSTTMQAITFLCTTYQHSLRVLILRAFQGNGESIHFQETLQSSPLHFKNLERLHLPNATYDTSLFASFKADKLRILEVGWLTIQPGTGSREDKWSRGLSHPSLNNLSHLIINSEDPDPLRKHALSDVCQRLGIKLRTNHSLVGSRSDPNDIFDINPEENVDVESYYYACFLDL